MQGAEKPSRSRLWVGWLAVVASLVITCFWAFWGIVENFHEGWYAESFWVNLGVLFVQYLSPMLLFELMALASVWRPTLGAGLHAAAAVFVLWFFRGASLWVLLPFLSGPLLVIGAAFYWGRPEPRRWAFRALVTLPLATVLICGAEPAYRVSGRVDDGIREARLVEGNGLKLAWAPRGPGWPDSGVSWDEAVMRCRHLSADGLTLEEAPLDIWRLPTVNEAVRSQCRHGRNSGGTWDAATSKAAYQRMPDKESPLWDVHSKIIYWWTATEVDDRRALIIVYNGTVWPRPKNARWGYLGFRAVKNEK